MTIETILIMMFLGEVFLIVFGMSLVIKLILGLARKLKEVVRELEKNN